MSIVQLSRAQSKYSLLFSDKFHSLIQIYIGRSAGQDLNDLQNILEYWRLAAKIITVTGVVIEVAVYFAKYRELIEADRVDEILSIDYTAEIKQGTEANTEKLIRNLIITFKKHWLEADQPTKDKIRANIKKLTKYSVKILSIDRKLAHA